MQFNVCEDVKYDVYKYNGFVVIQSKKTIEGK